MTGGRRNLLDRLRRRGLRRDGIRAHRRAHFGADHHEYYVTPDDLVKAFRAVAAPTTSRSAIRRRCRRTTARNAGEGGRERCWPATAATNSSAAIRATRSRGCSPLYDVPRPTAQRAHRAIAGRRQRRTAAAAAQGRELRRAGRGHARPAAELQPACALGPEERAHPGFLARWTRRRSLQQQREMYARTAASTGKPEARLRLALHAGRERPAEGARHGRTGRRRRSGFRCSTTSWSTSRYLAPATS